MRYQNYQPRSDQDAPEPYVEPTPEELTYPESNPAPDDPARPDDRVPASQAW